MNETYQNHQLLELKDFLLILKRRKVSFLATFSSIFVVAVSLAFLLPPVYRSEATILIERQEIPQDLIETTVTGFVQERIESLSARILTRKNLWDIAEKHDVYPGQRSLENRQETVFEMKENISVKMNEVQASDPEQRITKGLITIAFSISFANEDPEKAALVTNELASLYIEQNQALRTKQATEVSEFLEEEGKQLSQEITALEAKLAEFKQTQREKLPELKSLNLSLYEKTDNEIERTKEQIRELEDQISALQSELAITKAHQPIFDDSGQKVLTGGERLSLLTAEYLRLSARYSAEHPDLKKLKREIEALGGESDVSGVTALIEELTVLKNRLSEAKRKYANDHPDVLSLQQAVAAVERGLQSASVSPARSSLPSSAPDNPRYVSLKTQLDAAYGNLQSEKSKLIQLNEKLNEYEQRLFDTPLVERDYKLLSRDYDNAKKKYIELKDKQLEARLAIGLESSSKAEQFSILQSAEVEFLPESPNRIGIALLGFVFAFGGGIGMVTAREYLDRTIKSVSDLTSVLRSPPLATIPYIENSNKAAKASSRAA